MMRSRSTILSCIVSASMCMACGDDSSTSEAPPATQPPARGESSGTPGGTGTTGIPLGAAALFTRASLDIRGVRPTLDELGELDDDPTRLAALLDGLMDDPRLMGRVKEMFAPAFRTRVDLYPHAEQIEAGQTDDEASEEASGFSISAAMGEEPLDLIAWILREDRPFTDVVLAEHTVIDPRLIGPWPLRQVDGWAPEGTVLAEYTDGRPPAGVISMNGMWWRHLSTEENANRGRANALSSALLCESYLDRPIDFPRNIDLTDSESIRTAIKSNAACAACHATLDPLASHLWGFMYRGESASSMARYLAAQERDWQITTEAAPSYYGKPTSSMRDLAIEIARDERFVMCAVKRIYGSLIGRPLTLQDDGALATHREVFLASGLKLKSLIRSILDDPAYRGLSARTEFGGRPEGVTYTLVTPEILASDLEDLTGYRIRRAGVDLLRLDGSLRAVAGGSDSGSATTPSTGLVLVQRRLSEAAAAAMVDGDTEGRLSTVLEGAYEDEPTAEAVSMVLRMATGREASVEGPEVAALMALWSEIDTLTTSREAWIGMLTAILADPERLVR
ncbi:MAG: hypothetical protein ACE366_23755 [Bradymonadia bacterium]